MTEAEREAYEALAAERDRLWLEICRLNFELGKAQGAIAYCGKCGAKQIPQRGEEPTICVDFNARLSDGLVALTTRGAQASSDVPVGSWVWLSDGEVRVRGQVVEVGGVRAARVVWGRYP